MVLLNCSPFYANISTLISIEATNFLHVMGDNRKSKIAPTNTSKNLSQKKLKKGEGFVTDVQFSRHHTSIFLVSCIGIGTSVALKSYI